MNSLDELSAVWETEGIRKKEEEDARKKEEQRRKEEEEDRVDKPHSLVTKLLNNTTEKLGNYVTIYYFGYFLLIICAN